MEPQGTKAGEGGSNPKFRPSEFMRARRPHLFSDSTTTISGVLTKDVFGNHLNTITAENKESQFQRFCVGIAGKELARNLLPQTGPVGGGDGKVDAETYPVDEAIAETWYDADPLRAASERWAFAISANANWKKKLREDVEKILGTNRGYTKVYFMTNQYVSSREQSAIRDAYAQEKDIEVWICDRTWIVETVFRSNHLQLASKELDLPSAGTEIKIDVGPNDAERLASLKEIEEHLADPEFYNGTALQKIADSIEAGKLARGLGKPREEVDRLFYRAMRLAEKYGSVQQRLRVVYNQAWTANWWFDDLDELNDLYPKAVELATGTMYIDDMELICNLWSLVHAATSNGYVQVLEETINDRAAHIRSELARFIGNSDRPNAQHQAKMLALHNDFILEAKEEGAFEKFIPRFIKLIEESQNLLDFPMETAEQIYTEFGDTVEDSEAYDEGLELLAKIMGERNQESKAGEILLNRGLQKLRANRHLDAIRFLGRAQNYLGKEESKRELKIALGGCADAYESLGLLWAARSCMLSVVNLCLPSIQTGATIAPSTLASIRKMVFLELQLGRVWYTLSWMELASVVGQASVFSPEKQERLNREMEILQSILGIQLLKTPIKDLEKLAQLPAILHELELSRAWMASMYALGYESELKELEAIPVTETAESILPFFRDWIHQPASNQVRSAEYFHGPIVSMETTLLGCNVRVDADPDRSSVELGEIILTTLEAFLATSLGGGVLGIRHEFVVRINKVAGVNSISFQIIEDGGPIDMSVAFSGTLKYGSVQDYQAFGKQIQEIVVGIIPRIIMGQDLVEHIEKLIRDEEVLARAFNFISIGNAIYNTLGAKPKLSVEEWVNGRALLSRPLLRIEPWFEALPTTHPEPAKAQEHELGGKIHVGIPEEYSSDEGGFASHQSVSVSRVINHGLWEQAKWTGTMFLVSFRLGPTPFLGLTFENEKYGKAIFAEWKRLIADTDEDDFLDVTIITGISKESPNSYRMVLTPGRGEMMNDKKRYITYTPKYRTMYPVKPLLSQFLNEFKAAGSFYLIPGSPEGVRQSANPLENGYLKKSELTVIPAWKIDEDNMAMMVLEDDDDVIIPDGEQNPPILKALAKRTRIRAELRAKATSGTLG